jgi:UDP-sulfoquinovose synthase
MNVLVLGGDGYLGWPTALHLSARGYDVTVVDNMVRREYDREMGVDSLVPIAPIEERVRVWKKVSGNVVKVRIGNLTDAAFTSAVVAETKPEAIVHFGEQRSAPYSMIDREHAVYTQVNNVVGTLNVMYAIAETDRNIH